ncbi:DNA primase, partial [bacterium]|nr:DNA primase [bacterium]
MMERDSVEKVKASVDIVSVISGYVSLKKRGRTHVGLCPFHKEKTPSFHVDEVRQTYKCFGCGKGGDVFSFLMDMKGTSFLEVLKDLGREAGIAIETPGRGAKSENSIYYEANAFALAFYKKMLMSAKGGAARDYLKARGISQETMEGFEIGFAPDSWDELTRSLKAKGISMDTACRCGLLAERKNGGYYDRFRGRVMFPIRDISSEVVGFGGRIMGPGEPKYLNTPESAIFKKRKLIYNLWNVKSLIRGGPVVVVE